MVAKKFVMIGVTEDTKKRMKKARDSSKFSNLDELINDALNSYEGPRKKINVKCKEIGELMDIDVIDQNYIAITMYLYTVLIDILNNPHKKNKLLKILKEFMEE